MITGDDHVFMVHGSPASAVERFLTSWAETRPDLRWALAGGDGFRPWGPAGTALPEEGAEVLVSRDEAMLTWWDEHGYAPDGTGEGPFAVLYEAAPWSSLRVTPGDDPYGAGELRYEPYEVELLGTGFHMVTVVTPGTGGFSDALLAEFRTALTAS
ncbi:hypothetical protein ACFWBN_37735 [Streptomyces sp. NPDC059989]|uniref:hypothetical protein n=1 Tax=Streptomyces sp. NPDC059989 TaxID=3347026 RepID=UPI0036C70DDD